MTDPGKETLIGGQLLVAIAAAMVAIFRDFLGKGPEHCKAHWAGRDMLVVLLAGGFSVAEQSLFAAGRGASVRETRREIQETLAERLKGTIEELTGRRVTAFMSASHQDPDLSVELFVLEPET